ncbi:MAG: Fic family protein [Bacilli bacterium]
MIINHKDALSFILDNPENFLNINLYKLEELHHLISKELPITKGIRKSMVGITGTNYRPLDNEFEIKEVLEKLFLYLNKEGNPVGKALVAVAMISYIQPFEDGNKRVARMLGNAILLANDLIPVSFVGIDNLEYKKAVILFYEQNSIAYLKELFIEQYALAVNKYF